MESSQGRKFTPLVVSMNCTVRIDYTNYRGERGWRNVVPQSIWHGYTEYHPNPQWLMTAWDVDKRVTRTFALQDIHAFENLPVPVDQVTLKVTASDPLTSAPHDEVAYLSSPENSSTQGR